MRSAANGLEGGMALTGSGGSAPRRAGDLISGLAVGVLVGACLPLIDRTREPRGAPAELAPPVDRRWRAILLRSLRDFGRDRIAASAAGVTFYALLAIFPALSAFVSLYGLVANVAGARHLVLAMSGVLPGGMISVIGDELTRLTSTGHGALGLAFAASVLVSIWSANAGAKALIDALNIAYATRERRGFVKLTLTSLAFTVGGIAVGVLGMAAIAAAPARLAGALPRTASIEPYLHWPALLVLVMAMISLLYRFGPDRPGVRLRWITPGAAVATLGWLGMSALFSWYVANFGSYNKTYGSLGAIVGFLTWIWLSLMVLLYGAELNAEIEAANEPGEAAR